MGGQCVKRHGAGARQRLFRVAHDLRQQSGDHAGRAAQRAVPGPERRRHRLLGFAFVVVRRIEGDGEAP